MRIFLVMLNTDEDVYLKAENIITELGAESYSAQEEFVFDGVQDPYRAVDESDAIIWIEKLSTSNSIGNGNYNHLYGDTVLRKVINSGKPILHYQIITSSTSASVIEAVQESSRKRILKSLSEIEELLRLDLPELISGINSGKC